LISIRFMVEMPAPGREFPLLMEDESLLAIDKPAGVAVHGGSGVSFGVIEQLRQARPQARFLELVHRLDRETSGILLVARKRSALKHLQDQFRERETGKTYLALVVGDWPASRKVIDAPLHKYLLADGERRVKVVGKDDPDGMKSVTLVQVRQRLAGFTLLEVTIKTGRTHQIRVHLASQGHPIAGRRQIRRLRSQQGPAEAGIAPHVPARLAVTVQSPIDWRASGVAGAPATRARILPPPCPSAPDSLT
jgi:23S rRNA pseudouridine955/2504/2580 synthase